MAHLDLQRGTYYAADSLLHGRASRKIGHNTRLERLGGDPADGTASIGVRYHATVIYTMREDGWAILNTGGWRTVTTLARLNALLPAPWRLGSDRGTLRLYNSGQRVIEYADGLAVNTATGAVGWADVTGSRLTYGGRISTAFGAVGTMLTAAEVAECVAAGKVAEARRAELRAARLLREHPEARDIPAEVTNEWAFPRPHRGGHSAYGCAACEAENVVIRANWKAAMTAEHATGHPRSPWGSQTGPMPCPWNCPVRAAELHGE